MLRYIRPLILCCVLLTACANSSPTAQHSTAVPVSAPTTVPTSAPTAQPMPTATSVPTAQSTPAEAEQHAYFVDATGDVRAWSASTGTSAPIVQLPVAVDAVLAPNGALLAFNNNGAFFLRDLRSGVETNITPDAAKMRTPLTLSPFRWSPDSRSVLFDLDVGDDESPQLTIFRADVGNGIARPLTMGIGPAWSPDGRTIAYAGAPFEHASVYGGGPGGQLTLAHADGSGAHALNASTTLYPQYQPILWSSDGTRLSAADMIVDVANRSVIAHAPHADGEVLNTIIHLAPNGRSFGTWRVVRHTAPGQDDPGTLDETNEFLWVGEGGQATTIVRGEEGTCPCMPLATIVWVAWQADGAHALLAGSMTADGPSGLWLYTASTHTTQMLSTKIHYTSAPLTPLWSPDKRYALLEDRGEVWELELGSDNITHIGTGQWLGWAP